MNDSKIIANKRGEFEQSKNTESYNYSWNSFLENGLDNLSNMHFGLKEYSHY